MKKRLANKLASEQRSATSYLVDGGQRKNKYLSSAKIVNCIFESMKNIKAAFLKNIGNKYCQYYQ